jgi:glycosyltransferase involved in cell wall biosynthesis
MGQINITIDIVTICKNSKTTIQRLLDSISLNRPFFENFIVIDGCSNDGTLDILKNNSNIIDKLVSEKDEGISDAFNKGINLSTSDFILLLNSDDYLYNDNLKNLKLNLLAEDEFVSTTLVMNNGVQELLFKSNIRNIKKYTSVYHPGLLVSKTAYFKYGRYDNSFKIGMDYDFIVRSFISGARFRVVDIKLVVFADGGISNKNYINGILDGYRVRNKYFNVIFPSYELIKLSIKLFSSLLIFLNLKKVIVKYKYKIYKFIFE